MEPLGGNGRAADPKGFGYGQPFQVRCRVEGAVRTVVVARTRPVQGFGHDYPEDRAWQALYAHRAYNTFPGHVRSLDVGFRRADGELVSAADAVEFFQLVEKADGALYWLDLDRLLTGELRPLDVERATALARFLARAHGERRDEPTLYARRIRELVGHGECLMGILDSYPHPYPLLPSQDCEAMERAAVGWRWRLRSRAARLARVHGDFHPWNLLFGAGADFSVLDRSRGEWGEAADDTAALGINYLFFGLRRRASRGGRGVAEPFRVLWGSFFEAYLDASGDADHGRFLPPFLAFRALVVAHPVWYPNLDQSTRRALIGLAKRLLSSEHIDPLAVPELLSAGS
ncbi:MAG TPA: aminoglycoside phosphotransferase family protein [Methylomirabilota bacterium]|nr:aminoglycoside phosphotransferase family protein [Methylomirabilota bacterium]